MATPKNGSVLKAFTLLRSFRQSDEWLTSSELSRRARLPEASGYRLMQTLEGIGAVVRDSRGRYRPGMLLLALSQDIIVRELWREAPQNLLNGLARELDVSVHVGVLEEGMVTYVAAAGKPRPGIPTRVGMQFEAYCTALGKVLLSSLPDDLLEQFLWDGELIALTENTITDRAALRATLGRVRSEGYAVDDQETLESLGCLAAPIRNSSGRIVAAISISDNTERMGDQRRKQLCGTLFAAANAVGQRLYPWRDQSPLPFSSKPVASPIGCSVGPR